MCTTEATPGMWCLLEPQSVDFVAIRHEDDMGLRDKCVGPAATLQHIGEAYVVHTFPAISGRYGEGRVSWRLCSPVRSW